MALFEPWIGNSNPTDQQKNDYIRKLKAALIDTTGLKIESGTYTGDGSNPRTIQLTNTELDIDFIVVGDDTGTNTMAMSFTGMNPKALIWLDGAAPTSNSTAISSIGVGEFAVNDATYTNANLSTYYYIVFGT